MVRSRGGDGGNDETACPLERNSISIRGRNLRRLLRSWHWHSYACFPRVYWIAPYSRDEHPENHSRFPHQLRRSYAIHMRGLDPLAEGMCHDLGRHRGLFPRLLLVSKNSAAT